MRCSQMNFMLTFIHYRAQSLVFENVLHLRCIIFYCAHNLMRNDIPIMIIAMIMMKIIFIWLLLLFFVQLFLISEFWYQRKLFVIYPLKRLMKDFCGKDKMLEFFFVKSFYLLKSFTFSSLIYKMFTLKHIDSFLCALVTLRLHTYI